MDDDVFAGTHGMIQATTRIDCFKTEAQELHYAGGLTPAAFQIFRSSVFLEGLEMRFHRINEAPHLE